MFQLCWESVCLSMLSYISTAGTPACVCVGNKTPLPAYSNFCRQSAVSISSNFEYDIPWPNRFRIFMSSTFSVRVFTAHGSKICFEVFICPNVTPYIRSWQSVQTSFCTWAIGVTYEPLFPVRKVVKKNFKGFGMFTYCSSSSSGCGGHGCSCCSDLMSFHRCIAVLDRACRVTPSLSCNLWLVARKWVCLGWPGVCCCCQERC